MRVELKIGKHTSLTVAIEVESTNTVGIFKISITNPNGVYFTHSNLENLEKFINELTEKLDEVKKENEAGATNPKQ